MVAESSLLKVDSSIWDICLEYEDKNNATSIFSSEGNLHPYPAKAVPDMIHDLLLKFRQTYGVKNVLDPFVGSGTVALESKLLGLDFYGFDLNPLAVLLAKTKSLTIKNTPYIKGKLEEFSETLDISKINETIYILANFKNIDYWFKKENIAQLSYLKHKINLFLNETPKRYRRTFCYIILTAFSATIRGSSLTRNEEFKLYRLPASGIAKFKADSIQMFKKRINEILNMIQDVNAAIEHDTICDIYLENAKSMKSLNNIKVDLVLTSPPYGDSQSTVAYGEFSKLSVQWMSDLMKRYLKISVLHDNCDEYLLGGKYSIPTMNDEVKDEILNHSDTLNNLKHSIAIKIRNEIEVLKEARSKILQVDAELLEQKNLDVEIFNHDDVYVKLIRERIRLYIYRKINVSKKLDRKQVKKLNKFEVERFFKDLKDDNEKMRTRKLNLLKNQLPAVVESIDRKLKSLPEREKEILDFFIDLYKVVKQTDAVISNNGIQVWIVGHRTVFGDIQVKMVDVLNEWLEIMNYKKIAILRRSYHHKRLPHHIKSTVTRTQDVKTMTEEHILIVQKQ